jgi:superfamily I DNA/RNA helicase/RecB family exonuclease
MASPRLITDPATRGEVRLIGGPGTGKTTLIVDAAAAHIASGVDPESVLLLCPTARSAVRTRRALSAALASHGGPAVIRRPLVRTLHSYAFAVLRLAARRTGGPPPRLVTGTEQDGVIRELLAGDLQDGPNGAVAWPDSLRPALATAGFATQLRDLLARCAERGVDRSALKRIGRLTGRPEWVAAAQFARQYEQVMLLRAAAGRAAPQATVPALGAAELVGAALEAFATDPGLLAAERSRVRVLLVDDAQHLDPQAARLVRVMSAGAALTVVAGDPNQTVFGFRGAEPALLGDEPLARRAECTVDGGNHIVTLTKSHRCAPAVARAVCAVASRLPGRTPGRVIDGTGEEPGSVDVRVASSAHAEAALIADELRRAHLVDKMPWAQMAVIVRSMPHAAAVLPRALAAAGIPVRAPSPGGAPADHPAVRSLLTALAAATDGLTGEKALTLVTGPIGRIDPVSLRGLRRSLRCGNDSEKPRDFGDLLVDALTVEPRTHPTAYAAALRRVRAVLDAAARLADDDPRHALWQAWSRSGLQRRWLHSRNRGGIIAAQADRDLDAVTALFDIADDYVAHTPGATARGLVEAVTSRCLPAPDREAPIEPDAVAVVSAHAALGREWDLVVIAGLQEGLWPNTVPRGGVLATQQLVDVLDGVADTASRRAPVLAEERRLLVSALGRARLRVLITAVDNDADDVAVPSVFVDELRGLAEHSGAPTVPADAPRVLTSTALVGRLRAVVCSPEGAVAEGVRRCAATQLARLAAAGVPGADPASWYGMTAVSTDRSLLDHGPVTLSPSTLAMIADCPLRWVLEHHGGTDGYELRTALGSVLHTLIAADGKSEAQLVDQLEKIWDALPFDSQWYSRNELARHRGMLSAFCQWRAQTRHELTVVGTEVDVDGVLPSPHRDLPDVRVRGRIDRLERDGAGRLVVVDVKTGKQPVSKDDAQRHAQLAIYQLAVAAGFLPTGTQPGGGRLVYLGKPGTPERDQDALTPDAERDWRQIVHRAAAATSGPDFLARVNDGCGHCPVRSCCPAREPRS